MIKLFVFYEIGKKRYLDVNIIYYIYICLMFCGKGYRLCCFIVCSYMFLNKI